MRGVACLLMGLISGVLTNSCNPTEVAHSDMSAAGSINGIEGDSVAVTCDGGFAGAGSTQSAVCQSGEFTTVTCAACPLATQPATTSQLFDPTVLQSSQASTDASDNPVIVLYVTTNSSEYNVSFNFTDCDSGYQVIAPLNSTWSGCDSITYALEIPYADHCNFVVETDETGVTISSQVVITASVRVAAILSDYETRTMTASRSFSMHLQTTVELDTVQFSVSNTNGQGCPPKMLLQSVSVEKKGGAWGATVEFTTYVMYPTLSVVNGTLYPVGSVPIELTKACPSSPPGTTTDNCTSLPNGCQQRFSAWVQFTQGCSPHTTTASLGFYTDCEPDALAAGSNCVLAGWQSSVSIGIAVTPSMCASTGIRSVGLTGTLTVTTPAHLATWVQGSHTAPPVASTAFGQAATVALVVQASNFINGRRANVVQITQVQITTATRYYYTNPSMNQSYLVGNPIGLDLSGKVSVADYASLTFSNNIPPLALYYTKVTLTAAVSYKLGNTRRQERVELSAIESSANLLLQGTSIAKEQEGGYEAMLGLHGAFGGLLPRSAKSDAAFAVEFQALLGLELKQDPSRFVATLAQVTQDFLLVAIHIAEGVPSAYSLGRQLALDVFNTSSLLSSSSASAAGIAFTIDPTVFFGAEHPRAAQAAQFPVVAVGVGVSLAALVVVLAGVGWKLLVSNKRSHKVEPAMPSQTTQLSEVVEA